MENESRCTSCGAITPQTELVEFDDEYLCPECFRENTVVCDRCGERVWTEKGLRETEDFGMVRVLTYHRLNTLLQDPDSRKC